MEKTLRTFIALELSPQIRQSIAANLSPLKTQFRQGFKWVRPENLHLTMKFIGQLPETKVETVQKELDGIANQTDRLIPRLHGTGVFPSWKNPRTLWIGLEQVVDLIKLASTIEAKLEAVGIPAERKAFTAHLTICRFTDNADIHQLRQLELVLQGMPVFDLPWQVDELVFFKSDLAREGPTYTVLSRHPFKTK